MTVGTLLAASGFATFPFVVLLMGAIPLTSLLQQPDYHEPLKKAGVASAIITIAVTAITVCILI